MNPILWSVTLASAISPPSDKKVEGSRKSRILLPEGNRSSEKIAVPTKTNKSETELPQNRENRLLEEGVRKPPEKPTESDYVSVMKARLEKSGTLPNRAPNLRFSFGFGSWFPIKETNGRKSKPQGAHHLAIQIWGGNDSENVSPLPGLASSNYTTISVFSISTSAEVSVRGFDEKANEINYALLVDDFDTGLALKQVFQWPLYVFSKAAEGASQFDLGMTIGYLPLRQRNIIQFGNGIPVDKDFLSSGPQFNASGAFVNISFSTAVLSMFEAGLFGGIKSGFPFEVRSWFGIEVAFRDPVRQEPQNDCSEFCK